MAKKAMFGVNLYHKQKPRKRPGRHKKNLNKATKRMKKAKGLYAKVEHDAIFHKTSIGRNPSLCKMNKSKRRMFKKYRGQGR